ncbi:transglycosylase domain-containing protein [Alkalicoccobacillus porphyridii]|uniref:PBP1A family penicillin-binding protein n=1 Tax=Alkalicoccobacillus porphyridii TaxID=2597270 RepID=A0A553ZU14_9BACI|nr:PBP1A family penicillin-binding protein [Alkalicoccobacillus porphyridii]TSB44967.1 PBP1A family penicillin-binding protein [Alkalicoccobacillus porphyridii]
MQVVLNRKKKRQIRLLRFTIRSILLALIFSGLFILGLLSYTRMQGPPPIQVPQTTVFYGSDGSVIGEDHGGENRYWLSFNEMSPYILDATVSIEDRKFYKHFGFDPVRIGGAILANIKAGSSAQGASTITQQYARNLYLTHEKTWTRKWNELMYALRLEMNYSKEDILEGYLNTVYYGHGAYGIEAAANFFYDKSADELTLAEASMLAGVPKGPSYYSPVTDYERAKARQELILTSMVTNGYITTEEAEAAKAEELIFAETESQTSEVVGPYFQDVVINQLTSLLDLSADEVETGGYHIHTTLDPKMQKEAEHWVQEEMPDSTLQTSLVAIDPRSGGVRAMVGGVNYAESSYNRATQSKREPGSTIKPLLYYEALQHGFTAASTFMSEPTEFVYDDGRQTYAPKNFNNHYAEDFITMQQALAVSDNIFAIKTHLFIGPDNLVQIADKLGLGSFKNVPSLALGSQAVSLLDLTNSYVPFANEGLYSEPQFILKVEDAEGAILYEQEPELQEVLDPVSAFLMTEMMTGMFDPALNGYTSVTGSSVAPLLNRPVAGKSGSTPKDSWMVGFTPQLVTGVWVGHDRDQELNQHDEGPISKKIWANFTEHALEGQLKLPFHKPQGVTRVEVDPQSGLLANDACPGGVPMYFKEGTEPTSACTSPEEQEKLEEQKQEKERFMDRFKRWFGQDDH